MTKFRFTAKNGLYYTSDPDTLAAHGWEAPWPSYVAASPALWALWRRGHDDQLENAHLGKTLAVRGMLRASLPVGPKCDGYTRPACNPCSSTDEVQEVVCESAAEIRKVRLCKQCRDKVLDLSGSAW